MSLWKVWEGDTQDRWQVVSILVFVDVALKGIATLLAQNENELFQSLFSWMSLWKCSSKTIWSVMTGMFQSLFSWMSLWKGGVLTAIQAIGMFQSLFSWMSLWKYWWFTYFGIKDKFQSLFSWMSLWKLRTEDRLTRLKESFNPCFRGCRSERPSRNLWKPRLFVSILVFVDVALKGYFLAFSSAIQDGFNPCFRGCRSERGWWSGWQVRP